MKNIRTMGWMAVPSAVALGFVLTTTVPVATEQAAPPVQRDFTKELANKMRGTYVVAAAGGVLMQEPMGKQASAEIQRILREANTAIGHVEFYQVDRSTAPGVASAKDSAQDLADLGFDLVGPGDTQGGETALRTGLEALAASGIPAARADRLPVFQNLAMGRAALIVGPNPIRLSTAKYVTAEQLAQLKAIRDSIVARRNEPDVSRPIGVPEDLPDQVTIFTDTYVLGPVTGEIREEPNAADRQANILAVRNAKAFADFIAFSMPMPPTPAASHYSAAHQPHPLIVALAHEMVDNGMDLYVGQGNHVIQGIEIYKGRPIFYNMGDLSAHRPAAGTPESLTAFVATSKYQDGVLQEVRVYPVDLGMDPMQRPASKVGVAMTPSPEVAAKILADIQKYSDAFGTKILVENGVGVIRVPKEATVAIGQNIRDFGSPARGGGAGGRGGRGGGRGGF